jgi:hypothetical protein
MGNCCAPKTFEIPLGAVGAASAVVRVRLPPAGCPGPERKPRVTSRAGRPSLDEAADAVPVLAGLLLEHHGFGVDRSTPGGRRPAKWARSCSGRRSSSWSVSGEFGITYLSTGTRPSPVSKHNLVRRADHRGHAPQQANKRQSPNACISSWSSAPACSLHFDRIMEKGERRGVPRHRHRRECLPPLDGAHALRPRARELPDAPLRKRILCGTRGIATKLYGGYRCLE